MVAHFFLRSPPGERPKSWPFAVEKRSADFTHDEVATSVQWTKESQRFEQTEHCDSFCRLASEVATLLHEESRLLSPFFLTARLQQKSCAFFLLKLEESRLLCTKNRVRLEASDRFTSR